MEHWVLVRGLGRSSEHWLDFPGILKNALGEVQIHTPDLPGFGHRYYDNSPLLVTKMREYAQKQLPEGIDSFNIIGLSLGGMVAMDWAANDDRIKKIVLINSSSRLSPPWRRLKPSAMKPFLAALNKYRNREQAALAVVSNKPASQNTIDEYLRILKEQPFRWPNVVKQLMAAGLFSPPRLSQPGLIICSHGDRLVNYQCSIQLAKYLGYPVVEHQYAGHDLPLDDPHWLAQQIAHWASEQNA